MDIRHIYAVDTETDPHYTPFLGSSANEQMRARVYRLENRKEWKKLKRICEDPSIVKVMHPVTFDAYALSKIGIEVKGPVEDTYIAASIINEQFASRKLKEMARNYLQADTQSEAQLKRIIRAYKQKEGSENFGYHKIPRDVIEPYAVDDAKYTLQLYFLFTKPLRRYRKLYEFEKSLIPIVLEMEKTGMMIDRPFVKQKLDKYSRQLETIERDMKRYLKKHRLPHGASINFNSPRQIGEVLEALKIPNLVRTPKGFVDTSAGVLEMYRRDQPFIDQLLNYRFYQKQVGTYFEPLYCHYSSDHDPIAHFLLWQSGARTGRFSAELIQTIPRTEEKESIHVLKETRRAFRPRPGYVYVCIDYKAIEMRLFFHFANAKQLIEKVKAGWDPHDATCQMLFGKVTKPLRRIAKNINFGFIYGMGKKKLQAQLGLPLLKCEKIFDNYHRMVPIRQYMSLVTGKIYRRGYISIDYASDLMDFRRDYRLPSDKAYKGVNTIIQGSAAYVMKHGMRRVTEVIRKKGIDAKLLMTAHDELIFEVSKKERLDRVVPILKQAMEDRVTFKVPILADVKWSAKSWGDVQSFDE